VHAALRRRVYALLDYNYPDRERLLRLHETIGGEVDFGLSLVEAHILASAVEATAKLAGEIIEVGVYQGGSAKLICELKGERPFRLCDTFTGFPEPGETDSRFISAGQCTADADAVARYLSPYPNVSIHPGLFPGSAASFTDSRFSLAHLDVDLYAGTLESLNFLYPRMTHGGIILIHDYKTLEGVTLAVDRFFFDKPEGVMVLPGAQAMAVKS